MKGFISGVVFVGGTIVFGKCMYGLGRLKERKENAKNWKEVAINLNGIKIILEKKLEEES